MRSAFMPRTLATGLALCIMMSTMAAIAIAGNDFVWDELRVDLKFTIPEIIASCSLQMTSQAVAQTTQLLGWACT
jgi:hypothetical protein